MMFKLLYTLCSLISVGSQVPPTEMIHRTVSPITVNSDIDAPIHIDIEIDQQMTRNLCIDFLPYITNHTCTHHTLFTAKQRLDFITIAQTNLIVKPTSRDLHCADTGNPYQKQEGVYDCIGQTYNLNISAFSLNDSHPIKAQVYTIRVKNIPTYEGLILGGYLLCVLSACGIGMCGTKCTLCAGRSSEDEQQILVAPDNQSTEGNSACAAA